MSFATSKTRSILGIQAHPVSVEVHISGGLPKFSIVGLPETAVKESKDRVRSAIINSHYFFPSARRITVNLAPADLPKFGSGFDLPIAIAILAASRQIPALKLEQHEFIAELALDGQLRPVSSLIPAIIAAKASQQILIVSKEGAEKSAIAGGDCILTADSLTEICQYITQDRPLSTLPPLTPTRKKQSTKDWSDIKGQTHAKHALEIAASGGHSVLMSGPPGSGKTMLAERFCTLLPGLNDNDGLEIAAIHAIQKEYSQDFDWHHPPFRTPHHTSSAVALVGGGNPPKPGEISLAHHGVLFLDELTEFNRHVLETLRQPLESGQISVSRAAMKVNFPANFQLIAAMNPCPCGHWGNPMEECRCSPDRIKRYLGKLSAPFLDRIDIQIAVHALPTETLIQPTKATGKNSETIQREISTVRDIQRKRQGMLNAKLDTALTEKVCQLGDKEVEFVGEALRKLKLSGRAYVRLLKVARTIADMQGKPRVRIPDIQQALALKHTLKAPS